MHQSSYSLEVQPMKLITPQTIATMRDLRSAGKSLHDIARAVDVSLPTIHKYVMDIDYQAAKVRANEISKARKQYACKDCGIAVNDRAQRCLTCHLKSIAKQVKKCCDCGKELSSSVATRCNSCNQRMQMAKRALLPKKPIAKRRPMPDCMDCGKTLTKHDSKRCRRCNNIFRLGKPDERPIKTFTPSLPCKRCGTLIRGGVTGMCKSCCAEKLKEENGTKVVYKPIAKPKRCSCGALIVTNKCVACEVRG